MHRSLKAVLELTKSRSGKHASRRLAFIITEEGDLRELKDGSKCIKCKTYAEGEAREVEVELGRGEYLALVWLVRNLRNHVKGEILLLNSKGDMVFRAVYRRLKLRRTHGDPKYAWMVRVIADRIGLYVKKYSLE